MEQNNRQGQVQQQVQQMTPEELQKTQVLNLKEVEEIARIEKRTSKKPAILVGVIGIALLLFGSTFQIATTLHNKKLAENKIEKREVVSVNKETVTCNKTKTNNSDGTDTSFTITYTFEDDELIGVTKKFSITPTPGNAKGVESITQYEKNYQDFMNQANGYNINVNKTGNELTVLVQVNLKKLNPTDVNPKQKTSSSTSVDFEAKTSKDDVLVDMNLKEFKCE